ncbi:MAG: hypothetical protein Q7T48_05415 [Cellvibrio sp.]|uniref:hypothetical protein n=1 Tax=Cellvibrio sp. TaxID=1965322 RepID=UPI0027171CA7|nr:hypothetical protein [Cellvibrio sp.]
MLDSKFCLSIAISTCLLTLTACGGGGGGSNKTTTEENNTSSSNQSSSVANNPDFDAVTGVYDASITNNGIKDESYLYISGSGKITAYNYLGDSKDVGNNCYRVATEKETNAVIDGKTLTFSKANSEYTTTINDNTIVWKLDTNSNSISKIVYGGSITSSKIALTVAGSSLVVDSKKITSPNITDITSSLCK